MNLIGHARNEVPETARGLRCEMLFRHDTHTQTLMPLDVPAVIVVAPAGVEFADEADAGINPSLSARAARVPGPAPRHLALGPFPIEGPEVRLFNVQGLRYVEDNRCMDLAAKGLSVDVDLT